MSFAALKDPIAALIGLTGLFIAASAALVFSTRAYSPSKFLPYIVSDSE